MSKVKCSKCGISEFDPRWYSGPECRSCKVEAELSQVTRPVNVDYVKMWMHMQPTANVGLYSHGNMWVPYKAPPVPKGFEAWLPPGTDPDYCQKALEEAMLAGAEALTGIGRRSGMTVEAAAASLQLDVSDGEFIPRLGTNFKAEEPGEGWVHPKGTSTWTYRDSGREVWRGLDYSWYSCKDESCLVRKASSCAEACKTALEGWTEPEPEAETRGKLAGSLKTGDTYRTAKHHSWGTVRGVEYLENHCGAFWRVDLTDGNYQLLEIRQGVEVKS